MMSIPVLVVDRATIATMFALERSFIERWLAPQGKRDAIPQMPHLPGKPVKFHVPSVERWLLKYFQNGGADE